MLRHHVNEGIGRGLNYGLAFAQECGADWMLTVDQDSRLPHGYVEHLAGVADDVLSAGVRVGVMGALHIDDASGDFTYPTELSNDALQPYPETEELIASGSLWNVAALVSIGGFDSTLGMDAVDSAACLSLREAGYRVIALPGITFEHRIGAGDRAQILGRSVLRTGHSRQRRQSILANRLRLFPREWRQSPRHAIRTVRRAGVNVILGRPSNS
jgi:rhamnosyltransferase